MRVRTIGLIASMAFGLALPAGAQTMQTSPKTSNDLSIPTSPSAAHAVAAPAGASVAAAPIDLNSASARDLDKLPGIGKARAAAIIKHRPYKSNDELVTRHVLPADVYNGIKDKVTVRQG